MKRSFASSLKVIGFALTSVLALDAGAQGFPARQMTLIMPIAAGTAIEVHIRVLAAEAAKSLGQPIVVENRVGAGGKIGMQAMMNARNDGHTIGMTFNGIVVTQAIMDSRFAIQPGKDYAPVILTSSAPLLMSANAGAPFKNLKELIAYAKANPGKLSVSGSLSGSNAHLGWELLKLMTGTDITVVLYQGEPPGIIDMLNGLVLAAISSAGIRPHLDSGKLIGLATTGAKPWSAFPSLPTVEEAGVKGFSVGGLYGIAAPAGTPPLAVSRVNEAFGAALAQPEVRKRLLDVGIEPLGSTPDGFGAVIRSELEKWTPIIRKIGLKS